jgi:hypothetical protein
MPKKMKKQRIKKDKEKKDKKQKNVNKNKQSIKKRMLLNQKPWSSNISNQKALLSRSQAIELKCSICGYIA